jgi:hypothetical protein
LYTREALRQWRKNEGRGGYMGQYTSTYAMDIMDGTDLVLDMAIYGDSDGDFQSSPYTPPPRIRTPKEPEEKEFKSPRAVQYNIWCLLLGVAVACTSIFYALIGFTQFAEFKTDGFFSLGIAIILFLFYHCLEAGGFVPKIATLWC